MGTRDLRTLWSPPVSLNQERHTQRCKIAFFNKFIIFEKSPMKSVVGRPHYCFLKFSFSPGVRAVHRSQFQATSALWSKTNNLHYSLMRLPPTPPSPSPTKHTQLSYVGLRHSRGRCQAGPSQPYVTDPARHPSRQARSMEIRECRAEPGRPSVTDPNSVTDEHSEFIYMMMWTIVLCIHKFNKKLCNKSK